MSARIRRPDATETCSSEASASKRVRPPEFDTFNFYAEYVNLIFDSKRVLLRLPFFIDEDRTKYVSFGFHSARDYQPFVEFGSIKKKCSTILILLGKSRRWRNVCLGYASPCVATSSTGASKATSD